MANYGCEQIKFCFKKSFEKGVFLMQVIEILDGSRYDTDGELDQDILANLDRQDFRINTLHIIYPYGLNSKLRY